MNTNPVFVTGAGFTRAFNSASPLLVDDFNTEELVLKFKEFPRASKLLEQERRRHSEGYINIEYLLSRLNQLMPYDITNGSENEFQFLSTELKAHLFDKISQARTAETTQIELKTFAEHCATANATCITLNYDDFLDEALLSTGAWNRTRGYGFFCRPSYSVVNDAYSEHEYSDTMLLKLHGSVNWLPKLGSSKPYAIDSIVHHEDWPEFAGRTLDRIDIERHLESEPVIIPPISVKYDLVLQPILRIVWSLAFEHLSNASEVTFIGYSLPLTDNVAHTLFAEALESLNTSAIYVVGLEDDQNTLDALKARYRSVFGYIPDGNFFANGALEWVKQLPHTPIRT